MRTLNANRMSREVIRWFDGLFVRLNTCLYSSCHNSFQCTVLATGCYMPSNYDICLSFQNPNWNI